MIMRWLQKVESELDGLVIRAQAFRGRTNGNGLADWAIEEADLALPDLALTVPPAPNGKTDPGVCPRSDARQ